LEEPRFLAAAKRADIVFIHRRLFSNWFLKRLKRLNKKYIFDFDDAIFTSPEGHLPLKIWKDIQERYTMTLELADYVLAGNEYLRSNAAVSKDGKFMVFPTVLNLGCYPIKKHGESGLTLGWMGTSYNHPYLNILKEVLPPLSKEMKGLKFLVVSDKPYQMDGVNVENRGWSEKTEIQDLLDMDIGLMPLSDDPWTRGKCGLKALQYMACGIPTVCSSVGVASQIISDGINGFLPKNAEEWIHVLRELIRFPDKRTAIGIAGRNKIEEKYNIRKSSQILIELFHQLLD
jgi:glycosyltransferase involved in cell wall biosynthesis